MGPEISIITTIYNRASFLEAAVRSVRTQTFTDFEHILYDDGSTDGSLELSRTLARDDPRIRVVAAPHGGVVRALKKAHTYARGRFIGWLDSDDLLVDTALHETRRALVASPSTGLVFTDHVLIDEHSRIVPEKPRPPRAFTPDQLLTEFMTFHFRLFRREVFEACGGIDETFTAAPDYDFCLRASEVAEFLHLPVPLYCYRTHPLSISSSRRDEQIENSRRAVERAMERRGLAERFRLDVDERGGFSLKSRD
jgi:glycosyltransferase involved in cell wall biosynthesis